MTEAHHRNLVLWCGVLAGPFCWLASFQAKFSFNAWSCSSQTRWPAFFFALLALAVSAYAGSLSWREHRLTHHELAEDPGPAASRRAFMAVGGIVLSFGSCLLILAQVIPDLVFEVCQ